MEVAPHGITELDRGPGQMVEPLPVALEVDVRVELGSHENLVARLVAAKFLRAVVVVENHPGHHAKVSPDGPLGAPLPLEHELAVARVIAALKGCLHLLENGRSEERRVGKECRSRWSP